MKFKRRRGKEGGALWGRQGCQEPWELGRRATGGSGAVFLSVHLLDKSGGKLRGYAPALVTAAGFHGIIGDPSGRVARALFD